MMAYLSSPTMKSTIKGNGLKVFRIAVFRNVSYKSIEQIRIVYKSKIFIKIFQQFFGTSVSFQHIDRAHQNLVPKVPKVTVNHIDLRKIFSKYLRTRTYL